MPSDKIIYSPGNLVASETHFLLLNTEMKNFINHTGLRSGFNEILAFEADITLKTLAWWLEECKRHKMKIIFPGSPIFLVQREKIDTVEIKFRGAETWRVIIEEQVGWLLFKKWMNVNPFVGGENE